MARDERGKGGFGVLLRVLSQQSVVIRFVHLPLNAAKWPKGTDYFSPPARQSKKLDEEVARLHLEKIGVSWAPIFNRERHEPHENWPQKKQRTHNDFTFCQTFPTRAGAFDRMNRIYRAAQIIFCKFVEHLKLRAGWRFPG
jgi:hypothetical protein